MSDSQPTELREEERAEQAAADEAMVQDSRVDFTDSASAQVDPAGEVEESNPAIQSIEQPVETEAEADDSMQADADGPQGAVYAGMQQIDDEGAQDVFAPEDASTLQQDATTASFQHGAAEDELVNERATASPAPILQEEQPAEVPVDNANLQPNSVSDTPASLIEDEMLSNAAAWQASAETNQMPAAYAAALTNPELDPDHPLLRRAQDALGKQLLAIKYRLESEVREKAIALQVCLLESAQFLLLPA